MTTSAAAAVGRARAEPPIPEEPDRSGDQALVTAVRAGDREAVGVLYGKYQADGLRFARGLVRTGHDAEDVFHEAFTKTISAINNGYGPDEKFLAYLYTAVRGTAAAWWKRSQRELPVEAGDIGHQPVDDPRLDAVLDGSENERVLKALESLPKRWQTALWYADVLNEPPRRIAPLMGIAPNAVSALVGRARKGLRAAYLGTITGDTTRAHTENNNQGQGHRPWTH